MVSELAPIAPMRNLFLALRGSDRKHTHSLFFPPLPLNRSKLLEGKVRTFYSGKL